MQVFETIDRLIFFFKVARKWKSEESSRKIIIVVLNYYKKYEDIQKSEILVGNYEFSLKLDYLQNASL